MNYTWDATARRYRDIDGKFVAETRIKHAVSTAALAFSRALYTRTRKVVDDYTEDDFNTWARETREDIESFHNCVAVIALGGEKAALAYTSQNGQVWQLVGLALALQLRYWDRFVLGLVGGSVELDGKVAARAAMYPMAGYGTYENAVRVRNMYASGYDEERRVLESGNPCVTCVAEAAIGWGPIGSRRAIGDSECGANCRCHFEYRSRPAEDE